MTRFAKWKKGTLTKWVTAFKVLLSLIILNCCSNISVLPTVLVAFTSGVFKGHRENASHLYVICRREEKVFLYVNFVFKYLCVCVFFSVHVERRGIRNF